MLVFVVLVMLALTLLVHGALVEAIGELAASQAAARQLRAEVAARSGVQRVLDGDGGAWMDSVALFEARGVDTLSTGSLSTVTTVRRLATEAWLIEGVARLGGVEVARSGRLAWALDPFARVSALVGAVSVGPGAPTVIDGVVDSATPTALAPPPELGGCDPWLDSLGARYAVEPLAPIAVLPAGAQPALGLLDFESLLAAVEVTVVDVGTPQPAEVGGSCSAAEPWNWGDPEHPWRACGELLALRAATGDLRVEGGSGQGVLIVDGTVTLSGGARFHGLVIASGGLRLEDGAVLEGLALAFGGVYVASDATVTASACWAARALAGQRDVLGRMAPLGETGWIGPL